MKAAWMSPLERHFVAASAACLVMTLGACSSAPGASSSVSTVAAGAFDWQRAAGTTITVALNQHPLQEAVQDMLPQFEALTGIKVKAEVLPEAQYFDKVQLALSSGSGTYDAYMVSPLVDWGYIPGKWAEPLDPFVENASLTSPDWNVSDFFPTLISANRWTGENGGGVGEGGLYAIPAAAETYIMSYRKDVFEKHNLKAPGSWSDVQAACSALASAPDGVRGIIARGTRDDTADTGFIAGLTTWGGKDFKPDLSSAINDPIAVEFTKYWVNLMHTCGAPDWSSIQWYDMVERFNSGKYAMTIDADTFAPPNYELSKSDVKGKVEYLPAPTGPNGEAPQTDLATWGFGMASASQHKEAAWLFIQWATSVDVMTRAAVDHSVFSPTRKSVWESADVVRVSTAWGAGSWRKAVEVGLNGAAALRATPQPLFGQVYGTWSAAIQDIYSGQDAQATLDKAAAKIDELTKQAGLR